MNKLFTTGNIAKSLCAYPHGVRLGKLLFLSGIGSRNAVDNSFSVLYVDAKRNNHTKYCFCFANMKTGLEDSSSEWNDIIEVPFFLTNMQKGFP